MHIHVHVHTCWALCVYTYPYTYSTRIYTLISHCVRACIYVINATNGVFAEGNCTRSALSYQRDCHMQKMSCPFCVVCIREDVNVVEASLS